MTVISIFQLMATGAVAGLMAGFIGAGGGAILTPLCLLIFPSVGVGGDELIKIIFGTNMFLVLAFSASAVIFHHRNRTIDWRSVITMGPLAIIGSYIGGAFASISDSGLLLQGFAMILTVSSFLMICQNPETSGNPNREKGILSAAFLPLLGFVAGLFSSFLGVGGGFVMIPALILLFGMPVARVAATSNSVIMFIGFSGMLSYIWHGRGVGGLPAWSAGYVWWAAALPIAFTGVPSARLGAILNTRVSNILVRRISGAVLLGVALKMLFF